MTRLTPSDIVSAAGALAHHPDFVAGEQAALALRSQVPGSLDSEAGRAWVAGVMVALARMMAAHLPRPVGCSVQSGPGPEMCGTCAHYLPCRRAGRAGDPGGYCAQWRGR